jgi:lysophospholipase L1-like esterase
VDATARAGFVSKLGSVYPGADIIWLAIGTNDYGLNKWSAANFGYAYAALLDALHVRFPTATIYTQTPIQRTVETANTFGDTLPNYRTQITTAQAARAAWCTLVVGTGATWPQAPGDLDDGVHPTDAGHLKYANSVKTVLGL